MNDVVRLTPPVTSVVDSALLPFRYCDENDTDGLIAVGGEPLDKIGDEVRKGVLPALRDPSAFRRADNGVVSVLLGDAVTDGDRPIDIRSSFALCAKSYLTVDELVLLVRAPVFDDK